MEIFFLSLSSLQRRIRAELNGRHFGHDAGWKRPRQQHRRTACRHLDGLLPAGGRNFQELDHRLGREVSAFYLSLPAVS